MLGIIPEIALVIDSNAKLATKMTRMIIIIIITKINNFFIFDLLSFKIST